MLKIDIVENGWYAHGVGNEYSGQPFFTYLPFPKTFPEIAADESSHWFIGALRALRNEAEVPPEGVEGRHPVARS